MFTFLKEKLILPIIRAFLAKKLFFSIISELQKQRSHRRFLNSTEQFFENVVRFINNAGIKGDYLEFGVYIGSTFKIAFNFAQKFKLRSMNFYAFDSFKGLPKKKGSNGDDDRYFPEGDFCCDINEFKTNIKNAGVDMSRVQIVPGWYDETLNDETKKKIALQKAAVIMIDCDLYESTTHVLSFIEDYIQDGTIIIFDDWFSYRGNPNKGEQRAFREWLEKNPSINVSQYQKYGAESNSFLIHKN